MQRYRLDLYGIQSVNPTLLLVIKSCPGNDSMTPAIVFKRKNPFLVMTSEGLGLGLHPGPK